MIVRKKNGRTRSFGSGVLGALLLSAVLAFAPTMSVQLGVERAQATESDDELDELAALEQAYQAAADKIAPSVVRVWVKTKAAPARPARGGGVPNLFGGGDPAYNRNPDLPASGVIIGADGLIATAASFVAPDRAEVESITVGLADGKKVPATFIAKDENTDLALIKVEATGLKAATLGDSEALVPGRFVITVARSEGRYPHVTAGIVSAINRDGGRALQLDALINYGARGAAVVDLDGKLVGVVARLVAGTRSGQSSGVGFAAPIHKFLAIKDQLVAGTSIERSRGPFLGISAQQEQAAGIKGVVIGQVIEGTAAEKAGLKAGDVIKVFNGVECEDFEQLAELIRALNPGDSIIITVKREDWEKDLEIELGERPRDR